MEKSLKADAPIEMAVPFKLIGTEEEKLRIAKIVNRVAKSEFGKKTLEAAAEAGYRLDLMKMEKTSGLHISFFKTITLNPLCSDDTLVGVLAHEARHAGQYLNGVEPNIWRDTVKNKIMLTRAMEADADRAACVTCWELKQNGDETAYTAFEKNNLLVAKYFESSFNETGDFDKASTAAFKAWYQDPSRKNAYDVSVVNWLENFKSSRTSSELLKFDKTSTSKELIDKICFTEDGKGYFTDDHKFLEKGKFIGVYPDTMASIKDFMKDRKEKYGFEPDKSLQEIPVWNPDDYSYIYEKAPLKKELLQKLKKAGR